MRDGALGSWKTFLASGVRGELWPYMLDFIVKLGQDAIVHNVPSMFRLEN
jgi:hypothetical protein